MNINGIAADISDILSLPGTDFFATTSKDVSGLSLWTARAGLTKMAMVNFKLQAHIDPKGEMSRA